MQETGKSLYETKKFVTCMKRKKGISLYEAKKNVLIERERELEEEVFEEEVITMELSFPIQ